MIYKFIFLGLISLIINYLGIIIFRKFKLLDIPNKRKLHKIGIPFCGGICIGVCLLISIIVFEYEDNFLNLIVVYAFLMAVMGLIDDGFKINVGSKLIFQILPIFILIFYYNIKIEDIGDYNFIGKIELGSFSNLFTIFCVYLIINSTNYLDGADGTLALNIILSLISLIFILNNASLDLTKFIFILFLFLSIFLLFNLEIFNLPKLFLGDSGSLMLGFVISFLIIYVYLRYNIHPSLLCWILAFYVYEFLAVNIIRLKKKISIFKAGKDHIHHILINKFKSISKTNLIILSFNFFLISFGNLIYRFSNELTSLISFILFFFVYLIIRIKKIS
jgi:UDP-GlcNAc:undecaprenyl-phosphate GlcNAc-1-phosphate transferase